MRRGRRASAPVTGHPNDAVGEAAPLAVDGPLHQTLDDLIRIMGKVVAGDFSEKPAMREGEDALSRFVVALRFIIEDLERAHGERQEEIDRLRELDQMKTRFINLAAHELNTPLTPIRIHLHLLRHRDTERLSAAQRNAIEVLDRNLGRLGRSVGDLLDVARLQSDQLRIHLVPIDLAVLIRTLGKDFTTTAAEKGIEFTTTLPEHAFTAGDEDRLAQVVNNLLMNAFKFTQRGGRIHLSLVAAPEQLIVSVSDSGTGLTQSQIDQLFRPFVQVHHGDAHATEGTGLGLFISKGIVEAHGGRIWCDSGGAGQGARFSFMLPQHGHRTQHMTASTAAAGV